MALTENSEPDRIGTAVVTIRVPCGADGNLVTDAEKRLSRAEGIEVANVDGLREVEPGLSATIITVRVTIHSQTAATDAELRERLTDAPGLESIERIG